MNGILAWGKRGLSPIFLLWCLSLVLVSLAGQAQAATCTSVNATGNWNVPATWTGCAGGNGTVANTPGTDDTAIITGASAVITVNVASSAGVVNVNGGTLTQTAALTLSTATLSGTLSVAGGTLTAGAGALTVNGPTNVTAGTINLAANATRIFAGLVTINGGIWTGTNRAATFQGGITFTSGTFTAGTGVHTFNTNNQAITGTVSIPSVTITGVTLTNNGTFTIATAVAGTGTLLNTSMLIVGDSAFAAATVLDASTPGNTVNYNRAGTQTLEQVAYQNLILSGTSAKTMTGVTTIAGDLTISGAATMTGNAAFAVTGALNYASTGATTLSATTSISIGTYNQTAGTFNDNGNTITVTGTGTAWTKSAGTFTTTGTVIFTGAAPQIGASNFNNLTANTGAGTATLTGTATVAGNLTVSTGTLDLATFTANRTVAGGTLTVANGATLKIGGTNPFPTNYTAPHALGATSTVEYSGTNQNVLNEGAPGYGHLTLSGSLTKTALGSFTVRGDLAITGVTFASVATIQTVNGNVSNTGTHTATTGSITLSGGAAAHDLSGNGTYANLILNDALGATLSGSPTVSGTLTLTSGVVTTGINTLVTAAACNLPSVTRTSGWVNGNLQKAIPAGASTCNFEVGDATKYTPVSTTFAALTTAGNLTANTVGTQHPSITDPSSGLDTTKMVNRYWILTNGGVGLPPAGYSATFNFINPGDLTGGATTTNFEVEKWDGFAWSATTAGTRNATNTTATGIIAFGGFAVGEKKPPTVVSINCSVSCAATGAATVSWTVTFSRSVSGVNSGNFTLVNAGLGGTPAITGVSGSGTTWAVTASTGTGTGTLGLNMTNSTSVTPAVTNLTFVGQVYAINGTVINTYYPGTTASVAVGATSIVLGAATGATTPIAAGDMLLIMQIQDASVDSTNTDAYGDGVGGDLVGRGTTGVGGSGLYEYAIAASNVAIGGGTLTLCGGTTNAYTNAVATGTAGQKKYQVIRVPVYASIALTPVLTALAWNGSTGGVLAFDVTGALNLNTATLDVSGMGFRGGASRMLAGPGATGANTDYRTLAAVNNNASKGEGIAGTPQYVFTAPSTLTNTAVEGYPNGSHARGAPANAGGGATDRSPTDNQQNSGGGGGANGGAGGIGGIGWCGGGPPPDTGTFSITAPYYGCGYSALASATNPGGSTGGFGGAAVTGLGATRLTLGGGGGGGTTNNGTGALGGLSSSGAAGGGIIMLRAGSMTGAATFNANGSNADNTVANDGSGGGGAGGVVLISAGLGIGGATINVKGGTGGTNLGSLEVPASSAPPHGPGGGGGGGYAITTGAPAVASSAAEGANGLTYNNNVLFGDTVTGSYGAMKGSAGSLNSGLSAASIPGAALGTGPCAPLVDHYAISHSGTGITCEAEPVTIMAHGSSHASPYPDAGLAGKTISLTTNTSSGTWLSSADSCTRTCYNTVGTDLLGCGNGFTNTVGNNGTASYTFAAGESGIRLCLKQNSAVTQNINVTDGTATEATGTAAGEGGAGTDPTLAFSDTGIRFYADGAVDTLGAAGVPRTFVAGLLSTVTDATYQPSPQTLTIRALKTSTTTPARCVSLLGGAPATKTIQFAYQCIDPNTCQLPATGLEVNGTAVAGSGSVPTPASNVSVAFDASGYGSINLKYWDAGQIKLYALGSIADPTTGGTVSITTGASNTFLVRPYSFSVMACTSAAPCTTANTSAVDGTGAVFAAAGAIFNATVKAVAYGGSVVTPSFGLGTGSGTETVGLSQTLIAPTGMCAGPSNCTGTLGGTTSILRSSFTGGVAGVASVTDLNWSEVGVMTLTATNSTFEGTTLSPAASGISGNIGRFYPDHFGLAGTVVTRSDLQATETQTTPFTYMDEPMKMTLAVTAYNSNHSPASGVTQNYAGNFAKLNATTLGTGSNWFNTGCTGTTQCFGLGAVDGTTGLSARLTIDTSIANPTSTWTAGVGTFTAHAKLARNATPDGPYDTLKVGGMPRDSDGVTLPGPATADTHKVDLDATTGNTLASNPDGTAERKLAFTTKARYGQTKVANAYGSELLPLAMTATVQYCNAVTGTSCTDWKTNGDDSLTSIGLGAFTYTRKTGTTWTTTPSPIPNTAVCPATAATWQVDAGWRKFCLSAPGAGNTGNVTVPTNAVGTYLPSASGQATFGVYKGRNEFIYMRENY